MEKLNWHTVQKRVNDLIPQEVNPRKISDKQMLDLKKSLTKFGLAEIPACDFDGKILAGHQRIKALKLLNKGEELIDVRFPNRKLTEDEAKSYLISSNAISGDWDVDLLQSFDFDLLLDSGFDEIDLGNFWNEDLEVKEEDFNVEKELREIKEPTTKVGDLVILGKHRLICGDSTDKSVLERLIGEEKVSMIYSDPPYNINLDYSGGVGGKKNYGGNVKDDRTYEEYRDFINKTLISALSVTQPNAHIFYWCDQNYIGLIQDLYRENKIKNKRVCLWIKNSQNPTPGVAFNKCYEPCVYGTIGKPYLSDQNDLNEVQNKNLTTGNNLLDEIDLWLAKRLNGKDYEHATSKPIDLHEKAIKRCTKINDIILDSFMGSGSTLIAGELLKRRVYGIELEPRYCDLIIKRFEKLTGIKAIISHGEEKQN